MTLKFNLECVKPSYRYCSCLIEGNIWVKFKANRHKGSGDMQGTRNSRLNHLTYDLDSR